MKICNKCGIEKIEFLANAISYIEKHKKVAGALMETA